MLCSCLGRDGWTGSVRCIGKWIGDSCTALSWPFVILPLLALEPLTGHASAPRFTALLGTNRVALAVEKVRWNFDDQPLAPGSTEL